MTPAQLKALQDYQDGSKQTPEQQKALRDELDAIRSFENAPPAQYSVKGNLAPERLGDSAMAGVTTDPTYKQHELAALRELEQTPHEGFNASDRAAMAQAENQANRANRGRIGAIQQNMHARGASGTGMDMVAQMQSSQDANELQAMRALEREGMMGDRKHQATMDLGNMSSRLQGQDFSQQADKARAADAFTAFNAQNSNAAQQFNVGNAQAASNMNTAAANQHSLASMNAGMSGAGMAYTGASDAQGRQLGAAQMGYNAATEDVNRDMLSEAEKQRRKAEKDKALGSMIGGGIGAVAGGMYGDADDDENVDEETRRKHTMAGVAAGSSAGGAVGGAAGSYLSDKHAKHDIRPEHSANIESFLAMLEPKSYTYNGDSAPKHGVLAQDLERSAIGRDMVTTGPDGLKHVSVPDAIGGLLAAVAHLNRKIKG